MRMLTKILLLLFALTLVVCGRTQAEKQHRLVAYWGQNGVSHKLYPPKNWEFSLMHFCQKSKYDTIIMAFCYSFFDPRNKDSFPSVDFSYHCNTTAGSSYPFLLKCPNISDAVQVCQKNGKKVLLSLGGAVGAYGFYSASQPSVFAYRVWNLFLGGGQLKSLRPLGSTVLDGVDLDIEGGTIAGYKEFVTDLRTYMKSDTTRKYSITGAPQCPFPDAYMGPGGKSLLQQNAADFDEIHVQFYNNYCTTSSKQFFWPILKQWLNYSVSTNGPKILIGVPASKGGATSSDSDYRTPNELKTIYDVVQNETKFGGFMLWDASYDQNNIIDGKVYSEYVADIIAGRCPGVNLPSPTETPTSKSRSTPTPLDQRCLKPGVLYFEDSTNCHRFYQCSNGRAYLRICSANLMWNQKKLTCDWPTNVQCTTQGDESNFIVENLMNIDEE